MNLGIDGDLKQEHDGKGNGSKWDVNLSAEAVQLLGSDGVPEDYHSHRCGSYFCSSPSHFFGRL